MWLPGVTVVQTVTGKHVMFIQVVCMGAYGILFGSLVWTEYYLAMSGSEHVLSICPELSLHSGLGRDSEAQAIWLS